MRGAPPDGSDGARAPSRPPGRSRSSTAWLDPPAGSAVSRPDRWDRVLVDHETSESAPHDAIGDESFDFLRSQAWIRPRSGVLGAECDRRLSNAGKHSGKSFHRRKMCSFILSVAAIFGSRSRSWPRATGGMPEAAWRPHPPGGRKAPWPPLARRAGAPLFSEQVRPGHARGSRPPARKPPSRTSPRSVRIDSGCSWTPSTGSVRCRIPISTPSPVYAVATRSSGRSPTTSEW
jgi:hypothetical protein